MGRTSPRIPGRHRTLDALLTAGYRVRSPPGTQFRQLAAAQLRELLVKRWVLDDGRIKDDRTIGQDYLDELLERIRDIRASQRLLYQKITDIGATSMEYNPDAEIPPDTCLHYRRLCV